MILVKFVKIDLCISSCHTTVTIRIMFPHRFYTCTCTMIYWLTTEKSILFFTVYCKLGTDISCQLILLQCTKQLRMISSTTSLFATNLAAIIHLHLPMQATFFNIRLPFHIDNLMIYSHEGDIFQEIRIWIFVFLIFFSIFVFLGVFFNFCIFEFLYLLYFWNMNMNSNFFLAMWYKEMFRKHIS